MKKELFDELLEGVKQGVAIINKQSQPSRSFRYSEPQIEKIRAQFGLTQDKFASLMGISVATLRNWEQGRRRPEGPARVLLRIAAKHPEIVLETVKEIPRPKMRQRPVKP